MWRGGTTTIRTRKLFALFYNFFIILRYVRARSFIFILVFYRRHVCIVYEICSPFSGIHWIIMTPPAGMAIDRSNFGKTSTFDLYVRKTNFKTAEYVNRIRYFLRNIVRSRDRFLHFPAKFSSERRYFTAQHCTIAEQLWRSHRGGAWTREHRPRNSINIRIGENEKRFPGKYGTLRTGHVLF